MNEDDAVPTDVMDPVAEPVAEPVAAKPEAFSSCGCLRGELIEGKVIITQVNEDCAHNIKEPIICPRGACRDIAQIYNKLGL